MRFLILVSMASALMAGSDVPAIQSLNTVTTVASTVPHNGDINPYGTAIVPVTTGALVEGDVLVSNFNNSSNLQGTGSTIVEISPRGNLTVFADISASSLPGPCPGGIGLTTALVALKSGFVVVGSLPTTNGKPATMKAGCLIVLDSSGKPVMTIAGGVINGPWDMTSVDFGYAAALFVSNVLNGTVGGNGAVVPKGSVVRIVLQTPAGGVPKELGRTVIANQFEEETNAAALVIGPTGLAFGAGGKLYVADTVENRIAVIADALQRATDAGSGETLTQGGFLNGPLGLAIAANGDILTVNSGDGNLVEIDPSGKQLGKIDIDVSKQGAGTLFGLAVASANSVYFVDDGNNTLNLLH